MLYTCWLAQTEWPELETVLEQNPVTDGWQPERCTVRGCLTLTSKSHIAAASYEGRI